MTRFRILVSIVLLAAACTGGTGSGPGPSPTPGIIGGGGGGSKGTLFALNAEAAGNAVLIFTDATDANGDVAPTTTIRGAATQLNQGRFLSLDALTGSLYVANRQSDNVLVFESDPGTGTVDLAPDRVLTSSSFDRPIHALVDSATDRLYVSNGGANNILVFSGASKAKGNVEPAAVVSLDGAEAFSTPAGMRIGKTAAQEILFVADAGNDAVKVFDNPGAWSGTVTLAKADRTLKGTNTSLNDPVAIEIDKANLLIVVNQGDSSIAKFANPTTIDGNAFFSIRIVGAQTQLDRPFQAAYDFSNDVLYVASGYAGAVLAFGTFSGAVSGSPSPVRVIAGASTGLGVSTVGAFSVTGLAVVTSE